MDATTQEFANIPTLETWENCRQISADEWIGFRDGQKMHVRGKMPSTGFVLVQRSMHRYESGDRRVLVSGKIVINQARPSLWTRLRAWVRTWI